MIQRFLQGARKDSLWRSLSAWYPSGQAGSKRASFVVICRLLLPGLRSSRGSSLQRWISTERALHRVRTIRANGEMAAPMHGRTGVSPLHTLHPSPLYAFLQHACVSPRRRSKASTVACANLKGDLPGHPTRNPPPRHSRCPDGLPTALREH